VIGNKTPITLNHHQPPLPDHQYKAAATMIKIARMTRVLLLTSSLHEILAAPVTRRTNTTMQVHRH
jgi:hypothetical protein